MRLDFSQPYGELSGPPGAAFEQNGRYFRRDGREVAIIKAVNDDGEEITVAQLIDGDGAVEYAPPADELDSMHWKHLKALLESFGVEYENKEQALAFLRANRT